MLKVIDLFSGIGGFALGLESTGYFKTIQFVENEKWCQKILAKNFPGVPIHDDIKTYNTYEGVEADVVVGGFPCQPFSIAGKQKAVQDDRHLWPDMFRVIRQTKPTWVIGENVRNIVSISDGMVLEQVYLDLESQGYEVQSFIIPASAVNAPHQRYRTWIVAYSNSRGRRWQKRVRENDLQGSKREEQTNHIIKTSKREPYDVADTDSRLRRGGRTIRPSGENGQRGFHTTQEEQTTYDLRSKTIRRNTVRGETENVAHTKLKSKHNQSNSRSNTKIKTEGQETRSTDGSSSGQDVADTDSWQSRSRNESEPRKKKQSELSSNSTSERGVLADTDSQRQQEQCWSVTAEENRNKLECSRLQTRGYWDFEPNVGRVANGIPNRVDRLRGLGNAIVPQIAYQIGKAIMEAEDGESEMSSAM